LARQVARARKSRYMHCESCLAGQTSAADRRARWGHGSWPERGRAPRKRRPLR